MARVHFFGGIPGYQHCVHACQWVQFDRVFQVIRAALFEGIVFE